MENNMAVFFKKMKNILSYDPVFHLSGILISKTGTEILAYSCL